MKAPEIKHYINWLGRVEYRNINCSFTYDETSYLSGDGARAEALLLEDFDGSSVFHAKMLSLLAFCGFCDTMMAVHSDCPPSVEVVW